MDYSEVNIVSNFKAYARPQADNILKLLDTDFFVCLLVFVLLLRATRSLIFLEFKGKIAFSIKVYQFVAYPFGVFGDPANSYSLMGLDLHPQAARVIPHLEERTS